MSNSKRRPHRREAENEDYEFFRPQGVPRGLLLYWILHRIAKQPTHGYDILCEIEDKTHGTWRPGPGSVYPILKKLVSKGFIKPERLRPVKGGQHLYRITPDGLNHLKRTKDLFPSVDQRWSSIRDILLDLLEPQYAGRLMVDSSKKQIELAREIMRSKLHSIPEQEVEYMLREYSLNLEHQLNWVNGLLERMSGRNVHTTGRSR